MLPSVHAFFSQIVDYAGMFPPAKLPLEDALRQYLDYRRASPHAWMLGRMVVPARRIPELLTITHDPIALTALGQQSTSAADMISSLEADVNALQQSALVDTLEVAFPKGEPIETVARHLPTLCLILDAALLRGFLEIPFGPTWSADVEAITSFLRGGSLGLKLRAGGLTAEAFPSEAQIAFFIDRCRTAGLPWKATAGLHHPRRHWDASLQLWHHGFLNVFGAGILAQAHPLTEADLVAILSDRDGGHFRFDAEGFAWKDWWCPTARIVEFRSTAATSFGSCSFDEPCQDLIAMGYL